MTNTPIYAQVCDDLGLDPLPSNVVTLNEQSIRSLVRGLCHVSPTFGLDYRVPDAL